MSNNQINLNDSINELAGSLEKFAAAKTVVGDPVVIDDTIILPLVSMTFGMGTGKTAGNSAAGGMGGKISPTAVIVIHNGITRLINISTHTGMDRILDMVPDFVDRFSTSRSDKKEKAAREAAAEDIRSKVNDAANKGTEQQ